MYRLWIGSAVAFVVQFCTAYLAYQFTGSPKFSLAAAAVAAGLSGLILWGHILGSETGKALTVLVVLAVLGTMAGVSAMPVELDDVWRAFRVVVFGFVLLSTVAPPLWLWQEEHLASSEGFLSQALLIALPFGIGVCFGVYILIWKALFGQSLRRPFLSKARL